MRTAGLLLLAILTSGISPGASGPDRKEAKKLIAEYLTSTDDERCAAIEKRLQEARPKHLTLALKNALKKEETREAALRLIERVRVRGLHSTLNKYVDTPLQANVLRALVAVDDPKSHKLAFARWKNAEESSTQFTAVSDALTGAVLHPSMVALFRPFLGKKGPRGLACQQILKTQLALDDAGVERLDKEWSHIYGRFLLDNQPFNLRGIDLLAERRDTWALGFGEKGEEKLCTWKRGRVSLAPGGVLRLPNLGKETIDLIIKVLVRETDACSLGVLRAGGAFVGVNMVKQAWRGVFDDRDPVECPAADNVWTTVHIVITDHKATVDIDDLRIASTTFGGICEEIYFRGGTQGELFVGAVQLLSR